MENIPFYVYATFGLTLIATLYLFYNATQKSNGFIIVLAFWLALQSVISILGFYTVTNTIPPRLPLLLLPPLLFIVVQFNTKKGKVFIDGLDLKALTIIHIVRVPVEIVLYWLYIHKSVPKSMTFEGQNFDILSGITAPFIYYFTFAKHKLNKPILIGWNFLCIVLLLNIIIIAILSAPSSLQQIGLKQSNRAMLHFPFMFLPACIVPIILFSHLTSLRQLIFSKPFIKNFNKDEA